MGVRGEGSRRNDGAPRITPTRGEVEVRRDPRVLSGAVVIAVLTVAFGVVSASRDSETPAAPTTIPASPVTSETGRTVVEPTTTTRPRREMSLAVADTPCKIAGPNELVRGLPDFDEMFTPPTPQPDALIPGSVSVLQSDVLLDVSAIPESDYVKLSLTSATVIGAVDQRTGRFRRSAVFHCHLRDVLFRSARENADGRDHLWVLGSGEGDDFLLDLDLSEGGVAWAASCTACDQLYDGGDEIWAFGDLIGPQGSGNYPSGTWGFVAASYDDHQIRGPINVVPEGNLSVSPEEVFVSADGEVDAEVVMQIDLTTGDQLSIWHTGSGGAEPFPVNSIYRVGGHFWVDGWKGLVAFDPISFAERIHVPIPDCAQTWISENRIWYHGSRCDSDETLYEVELGWIDVTTGQATVVARYHTYRTLIHGAGFNPYSPDIANDETGFWYTEQIPTPTGPPGAEATSEGPVYLMHVDA